MIEILPNGLYSRQDLIEMLKPLGIHADSFVARVKPIKRLRMVWLGSDLLAALQAAPALNVDDDAADVAQPAAKDRILRGSR
jgi:hypothetical protein